MYFLLIFPGKRQCTALYAAGIPFSGEAGGGALKKNFKQGPAFFL